MSWSTIAIQISATQLVTPILVAIVTVTAISLKLLRDRTERRGHPFPPGPTPLPLLGNALSIDVNEPWLTYTAWKEKYGDVMYFRLLDTDMIVLNSFADATELLEKRSQIYSDRPFIATIEPYGHGINFGFDRYGPHWRLCRRIMHQSFRAEAALSFRPMQLRRARQMVINMVDDPNDYTSHFSMFASAVAMSAAYDYEPRSRGDPIVKAITNFCDVSFPALTSEKAVLLRVFPFLLGVPEWIPLLSRVSRESRMIHALSLEAFETPYQWVKKRIEANEDIETDTMVFDHIQRMEKMDGPHRAEYETCLMKAASTTFIGSVETNTSTFMTFTLAMVKNPHIWKRAQAEIDTEIGTDRLPDFEDRSSLPYVDAIIREVSRWKPVVPLGAAHAVMSNDTYQGYYIPRGATIIPNIWAMSRDEARFPDPEMFNPDRFLNPDGTLNENYPADFVFGFGRRICPGRHSADASIWSGIATMLATLDFNVAKDANGRDIDFEPEFVNGFTYHPMPFSCNITPRAHVTRSALQSSVEKYSMP